MNKTYTLHSFFDVKPTVEENILKIHIQKYIIITTKFQTHKKNGNYKEKI